MTDNPETPSKTTESNATIVSQYDGKQLLRGEHIASDKVLTVDNELIDDSVVPVLPIASSIAIKQVKPVKPPKPLTAREKNFTLNILKGMNATDSYIQAGYKCSVATAGVNGCKLLKDTRIRSELERLQYSHEISTIKDFHQPFVDRFPEALKTLDDLQRDGNDYVKLSATKEILDRVSPKVTRNESVKYTLPAKEKARLQKLIDITDISQVE